MDVNVTLTLSDDYTENNSTHYFNFNKPQHLARQQNKRIINRFITHRLSIANKRTQVQYDSGLFLRLNKPLVYRED